MHKLKIIFLAIGLLFWYLHLISCTSIIYTFVNSFLIAILTIVSPLSSPEMTFHNVNRFSALLSTTASRSCQGETMSYHYGIVTLNSSSLIASSYHWNYCHILSHLCPPRFWKKKNRHGNYVRHHVMSDDIKEFVEGKECKKHNN